MCSLCRSSKCTRDNLPRSFTRRSISKLPTRDQTALDSLPKRLANEELLDRAGLDQVKNRPQRSCEIVAGVRSAYRLPAGPRSEAPQSLELGSYAGSVSERSCGAWPGSGLTAHAG